jgi:predicted porin
MQKSLIALAVLSTVATAAQAGSSATIYGNVDTGVVYSNKAYNMLDDEDVANYGIIPSVTQGSYLGFKGTEDLGDGLEASFELEAGLSSSSNLFRQKSVVGLHNKSFGSILLGVQPGVIDDYQPFPTGTARPVDHSLDYSKGTQSKNSIRYNTPNISGFTASLTGSSSENTGPNATGSSFGVGGKYTNGAQDWYTAYYHAQRAKVSDPLKDAEGEIRMPASAAAGDTGLYVFSVGTGYHSGPAYLYGNWSFLRQPFALGFSTVEPENMFNLQTGTFKAFMTGMDNNSKACTYNLGVNYSATENLHLLADASYERGEYLSDGSGDIETPAHLTKVTLGANYSLSKFTNLYALASHMRAHEQINPGVVGNSVLHSSQTSVSIGIRQKF